MRSDGSDTRTSAGEPWGPRLAVAVACVAILAAGLQSYGIRTWPMADDEVLSLVTMGFRHVDVDAFSFPPALHERLPRAVPVWHTVQRIALGWLPDTEAGYRAPSVVFAVLTSVLAFLVAARWRGLWFAAALAIVMNGSQLFVHVAQVNRFYSLPMLLLAISLVLIWLPRGGHLVAALVGVLAVLTVLSHNVTVAFFGLAFAASVGLFVVNRVPRAVVVRSGAAFATSAAVYLFYLRPLISGWSTTGNPTQVLVSFGAYAGVPTLALGALGGWLLLARRTPREPALWWALLFVGSLCMFQLSTFSWNPRYFVFFLPPLWFLAAEAVYAIGAQLGGGTRAAAWYACTILLLAPNMISHFADGSRHDYRAAAAAVVSTVQDGELILSDDAETITYYLPDELLGRLYVRTKVRRPPASDFLLVTRANAWTPLPRFGDRRVEVIAEIAHRRLDQFSHVVRVFRVHGVRSTGAGDEVAE